MQELPCKPINIWLITDGRPGHESQLIGLSERLQTKASISITWINATEATTSWLHQRDKALDTGISNQPDIIIGAGHRTHRPLRIITKQYQAFSVVLMKPSLPKSLFDAIICPHHDGLSDHPRVLSTLGALNKITPPPENQQRSIHLMLIGGPSKHFDWVDSELIEQIKQICQTDASKHWLLSNSRRTPKTFMAALITCELENLQVNAHDSPEAVPLEQLLEQSMETWVSPDSVSMIYESLTARSPTALLELSPIKPKQLSRVCRGIQHLTDIKYVSTYQQWSHGDTLFPPPEILWEADRAAIWLLERFHKQRQTNSGNISPDTPNSGRILR